MSDVIAPELLVDGNIYGGWTGLRIQTSIERAASSFDLRVTERWPGGTLPELRAGQRCVVRLGDQVVITGWIDDVPRDLGPTAHTVRVVGRDATADLVDCAARGGPYANQDLLAIAGDQLSPFGIPVALTPGASAGAAYKKVSVEPGQSVFEFLERLARHRGLLLMPDGQGGLLLGRPSAALAPTPLLEGKNLLGARSSNDLRDRFSEYLVLGQSAGSDERSGPAAAHLQGQAGDAGVDRYRPLVVPAESGETDLDARADWEMRVRYGRGLSVGARVQGWQSAPGRLWRAGETVEVQAPAVRVQETLLCIGCTYSLDEGGTTTDFDLTRPEAFEPQAALPDPTDGEGW